MAHLEPLYPLPSPDMEEGRAFWLIALYQVQSQLEDAYPNIFESLQLSTVKIDLWAMRHEF